MKFKTNILSLIVLFAIIISATSCFYFFDIFDNSQEEVIYREALNNFVEALSKRDLEGIIALFSKSAIESNSNIQNNLAMLFEIYPDAPTQILFNGLVSSNHSQTHGLYKSSLSSTFPIFCNGVYYWVYLELVYEDDFCVDNIGISCIEFYTGDEYCIYYHSDESRAPSQLGFHLFADKKLENDVICIENQPYEYIYINRELSLNEVKTFLKSNTDFSDLQNAFGLPNASQPEDAQTWYLVYYEVFVDGVAPVYVELCIQEGNKIIYANLVNSTSYLENILEEDIE